MADDRSALLRGSRPACALPRFRSRGRNRRYDRIRISGLDAPAIASPTIRTCSGPTPARTRARSRHAARPRGRAPRFPAGSRSAPRQGRAGYAALLSVNIRQRNSWEGAVAGHPRQLGGRDREWIGVTRASRRRLHTPMVPSPPGHPLGSDFFETLARRRSRQLSATSGAQPASSAISAGERSRLALGSAQDPGVERRDDSCPGAHRVAPE